MKIGMGYNEYGTPISIHICDSCHRRFTVCPAIEDGKPGWGNCLSPECASYDPDRDADKFFEEGNDNVGFLEVDKGD